MRTWIYLTVLALALVALALGGWTVDALRTAARPLGHRSDRRKETS